MLLYGLLIMGHGRRQILWLGVTARVPFAAGIDSYLPKSFARVHPVNGAPTVSLWMQAVVIAIFIVLGQAGTTVKGAYNVLVSLMVHERPQM